MIDFNFSQTVWQTSGKRLEVPHVCGKKCFFSGHRISTSQCIPPLRSPLQRQLQRTDVLLPRSIFMSCLRATDLQRKFKRYRGLSAFSTCEAIPYGFQKFSCPQYAGQCKCGSKLAHIRRYCAVSHQNSSKTLSGRRPWAGHQELGLRPGFNHHRPVPYAVPLGAFPFHQERHKAAHSFGFAWQHTVFSEYYSCKSPRCQYTRPASWTEPISTLPDYTNSQTISASL